MEHPVYIYTYINNVDMLCTAQVHGSISRTRVINICFQHPLFYDNSIQMCEITYCNNNVTIHSGKGEQQGNDDKFVKYR